MSSKPHSSASNSSSGVVKTTYLTLYNFVSAALWAIILARTGMSLTDGTATATDAGGLFDKIFGRGLGLGSVAGGGGLYGSCGEFVKWTQTLAMVEIGHALFGIVRAPVFTTAMQVASRIILVWAIVDQFPAETSTSIAYSTMLLAWSATEVVRYSYFVFLLNGSVPGVLQWLRYNGFFLLYPMGISSEMWLVYRSIEPAKKRDERLGLMLWGILGLYVPGSYVLYTHMMTQRRRVMRGKGKARS